MKVTKNLTLIPALCAVLFLSACATQDDADVLFSDTEKAIIKTLVYTNPDDDPTNAYDQNSAAATLGQMFFWDRQFSGGILITGNRTTSTASPLPITDYTVGTSKRISCATCHSPTAGWADNTTKPNDVSLGANFSSRNAPTILNSVRSTYQLWDGAADSPWSLIRQPIEGSLHNFHRFGVAYVICKSTTPAAGNYLSLYTGTFGTTDTTTVCTNLINANQCVTNTTTCTGLGSCAPTSTNGYGKNLFSCMNTTNQTAVNTMFANFSKSIAAYERLIVSKNSAFDQWAAGNENAMSAAQKRGLKIFIGKGNCVRCHSGPNFSDGSFHNLGVPQIGGYSGSNDQGRYDGISTLVTGSNSAFNTSTAYNDSSSTNRVSGLSASTSDIGKFKVPTLRSVNKTAPYFHNGTVNSLWDVVNFYNFSGGAGNFPGTKDGILTTRNMTNNEMEDLVEFLKALEGESLSSTLTSNTSPSASCADDTACASTYSW